MPVVLKFKLPCHLSTPAVCSGSVALATVPVELIQSDCCCERLSNHKTALACRKRPRFVSQKRQRPAYLLRRP